jgi:hypothetical protein
MDARDLVIPASLRRIHARIGDVAGTRSPIVSDGRG